MVQLLVYAQLESGRIFMSLGSKEHGFHVFDSALQVQSFQSKSIPFPQLWLLMSSRRYVKRITCYILQLLLVRCVKATDCKPNGLSLNLGIKMVEGHNQLYLLVPWPPHNMSLKKIQQCIQGRRGSSAPNSICCYSKRSLFESQHIHDGSTPDKRDLISSSDGFPRNKIFRWYTVIYTGNIYIHLKSLIF